MRITRIAVLALAFVAWSGVLSAQGRGGGAEWPTTGGDAQRSSWIRSDIAISVELLSKPGFELQWKTKLENQPRQTTSLLQGVSVNGVTLFTPLSIVAGSSNNVFAIDNDTGNVFWQRHFDASLPAPASAECPGGITAAATRNTVLATPMPAAGRGGGGGGGGRGGYSSALGEPGEGAPVPARGGGPGRGAAGGGGAGANPPAAGGAAAAGAGAAAGGAGANPPVGGGAAAAQPPAGRGGDPANAGGRGADPGGRGANPAGGRGADPAAGRGGGGGGGGFGRSSGVGYVIASDGQLHSLGFPSGKDVQKPVSLVPANARVSDPIAVNNVLYTTTSGNCGGAPDAVLAMDLSSENKSVTTWKTRGGGPIGSVAFATDGTLLVSIGPGPAGMGSYANAIVALDAKSLQPKDWFTPATSQIASAPVVFTQDGKDIVAAALKDGRIVLLDAASLGGSNHSTPLYTSRSFGAAFAASTIATWQEMLPGPAAPAAAAAPAQPAAAGGAATAQTAAPAPPPAPAMQPGPRWLLLPISGALPADLKTPMTTQPAITNGAIVALKVETTGGKLSLQPAWISRDLTQPATLVVNGVVFALSGGRAAAAGAAARPAVLYALNGANGAELWNSGNTITSFTTGRSFWSATGQVYVGAFDSTVYAFGLAMERR